MKKIVNFLICLFASGLSFVVSAQTQQGYVKTLGHPNKKGVALSGVSVRVKSDYIRKQGIK